MDLDINIGDVVLGGKFKNHRIEVKSIGEDEIGQPVINGDRKLLAVRIEKKLPEGMWSSASLAEKYKEKDMNKQAVLNEVYSLAFEDELEKISVNLRGLKLISNKIRPKIIKKRIISLGSSGITTVRSKKDLGMFGVSSKASDKKIPDYILKQFPKPPDQLRQMIITGRGGATKNMAMLSSPPKSPIQKEMINRVLVMHELAEANTKKTIPFMLHNNPRVIMEESNLVRSLPKRYGPTKKYISELRSENESKYLKEIYPGFRYGETRLSRAGKKFIERKYQKQISDPNYFKNRAEKMIEETRQKMMS